MGLEDEFNESLKKWNEDYLKRGMRHSNIQLMLDNEGYKEIVRMGADAPPYLKRALPECSEDRKDMPGFMFMAVFDILTNAGIEFKIPKAIRGNYDELHKHAIRLLER